MLVQDLKKSYSENSLLLKNKLLKNRLKYLGIGFLLFKHIDEAIAENQLKIDSLIKNISPTITAYSFYLTERRNAIENTNRFLSTEEETNWLNLLESNKSNINYILTIPNQQLEAVLAVVRCIEDAKSFVQHYNFNLKKSRFINQIISIKNEILKAEQEYDLLNKRSQYFSKKELEEWFSNYNNIKDVISEAQNMGITELPIQNTINRLQAVFVNGPNLVRERNKTFVETEIQRTALFQPVEGKILTQEQRRAIVIDEANTLVVAGAGTGKTTTLLGKAQYLVAKGLAMPQEVLIVSFGADVRKENDKKINGNKDGKFVVKTYHSLGLKLILEAEKEKPTLSKEAEDKLDGYRTIDELLKARMDDPAFAKLITEYFLFNFHEYKTTFEFKQQGDYFYYLKNNEVRTLKGHSVRSLEECEIANFLFLNGVNYDYERPFKTQSESNSRMPYRPDFTLTDYDLCIEHFGIDRKNNTANWVDRRQYLSDMDWKIRQHDPKKLIKTFSYDKQEGQLSERLEKQLIEHGVVFNRIPTEEIFKKLNEWGRVNLFSRFLTQFLNLYKSSGKDLETLKKQSSSKRTNAFLEIFSLIYRDYEAQLHKNNVIDFNDMINRATIALRQKKTSSEFRYILVDEFQDTTQSQYRFLKALIERYNAKLFCVGDDWQAINRFAGGDLSVMTEFESNFGYCEKALIQETHRFCDKLCDFSTKFILANPNQIRKKITSNQKATNPVVTIVSDKTEKALEKIISNIPRNPDSKLRVLIMNRYKEIGKPSNIEALRRNNPDLSIQYSTVHSAKGLTVDYAIVIGLKNGLMGFPCQIENDPLLSLVHACHEYYPHAEERRLFYVALTRARRHVYLVIDELGNASQFIKEIQDNGYEVISNLPQTNVIPCPKCKTGRTIWRSKLMKPKDKLGGWGECTNSKYCDYRPDSCPECGSGFLYREGSVFKCSNGKCHFQAKPCPECDGYMKTKSNSTTGQLFLGCSNYKSNGCRHTEQLATELT